MPIITITTDFGLEDSYVAQMKGAMLSIVPEAVFIDVTHEVEPGNLAEAAYILSDIVLAFPPKTVHLFVVDPGVGSARRSAAISLKRSDLPEDHARDPIWMVGPDNGIVPLLCQLKPLVTDQLLDISRSSVLTRPVSHTFHGRDVFAPVTAHLSKRIQQDQASQNDLLTSIGEAYLMLHHDPELDRLLEINEEGGTYKVRVIHVDHFGNLVTSLHLEKVPTGVEKVQCGGESIPMLSTFSDAADGRLLAYWGSSGFMEIAVNHGSAAQVLQQKTGDIVTVSFL